MLLVVIVLVSVFLVAATLGVDIITSIVSENRIAQGPRYTPTHSPPLPVIHYKVRIIDDHQPQEVRPEDVRGGTHTGHGGKHARGRSVV